jgi:hypothetical protein
MHRQIARLHLQAAVDAARGRLALATDTLAAIAGDGNGNVAIPNSHDIVCRDAATGRVLFATNPDLHIIDEGEALQLVPMSDRAPRLWRVPPVRIRDVFWVAGADQGQTPGLFTPAHQFEFGVEVVDVAPDLETPYQFYVLTGLGGATIGVYRVTPAGVIDLVAGGGATPAEEGGTVSGLDWDGGSIIATTLGKTPLDGLVMVNSTARRVDTLVGFVVVPSTCLPPPNDMVQFTYSYEYDEIDVFVLDGGNVRNVRVRLGQGHTYTDDECDGVIPLELPSQFALQQITDITFARYNPAASLLFMGTIDDWIVTVPWPITDPASGLRRAFSVGAATPTDIAFNTAGNAYVATATSTGQVWHWAWESTDSTTLIAGDGSGSGIFPVDGAVATSGDLGTVGGLDFDAAGRLLIACTSAHRVAEVNLTTGTIRTLTGFGLDDAATVNLVEPLATAVFTDITSLQTDAIGRPYIGGEQIKRIGA